MCNPSPKVTFISVYYNRGHLIDDSVPSMLGQTYGNVQYILWDDNSRDDTFDKLLKFEKYNVSVYRSEKNQGLTKSLIEAIEASTGDFIAIHGSGDVSTPDRIERQVLELCSNSNNAVCGCQVRFTSESLGVASVSKKSFEFSNPMKSPATHGEVMFRRSYYNSVGGYRSFFQMSQDYDLWLRIRDAGGRFCGVDDVLYETISLRAGVSGSYKQRYVQSHYAQMAYSCWQFRQLNQGDLVDLYGANAWVFLGGGKILAKRMKGVCRLAIEAGDYRFTKQACARSLRAEFSFGMFILYCLSVLDCLINRSFALRCVGSIRDVFRRMC